MALYQAMQMLQPGSEDNNWEVSDYHVDAFCVPGSCNLGLAQMFDLIKPGSWLDVGIIKFYCT